MFALRGLVLASLVVLVRPHLRLKLLHVLFRHGDKVPHREYQNYPTDPHRNYSYYPIDNGGLTNEGMSREYRIGRMLRERYDDYFGPIYRPSTIYARSTEVPRTRMSLQLVLAGLFPPTPAQTWNPELPWIPTSTFSVPVQQDNLLFPHYCPRYAEEYKRRLKDDEVRQIIGKYKKTMDHLTRHTGKSIETTSAVYYLYNLLKEEAAQNLTLPEWSRSVYPNPMKEILALDFYLRSSTKSLKRMNGGMLLRKMRQDTMDLRDATEAAATATTRTTRTTTTNTPEIKAFLFAAHEVNIAALARALGTDDPIVPAYGSTIILESLQDNANRYYVRVLLWTGVTERLVSQRIPGCAEVCPLDEFIEITRNVVPSDEEYRCAPSDEEIVRRRKLPPHRGQTTFSGSNISRETFTYRQLAFIALTILFIPNRLDA